MIGDRTGTSYKLGDTVSVKLVEAAPLTGGMRFELAEANNAPAKPKFKQSQSRRRR